MPIDAEKDPEGYARYLKERAEKMKKAKQVGEQAEAREARLKKIKISGSREFKVGLQVMVTGLQKNPDKNGSMGTLVKYVEEKGRWAVEFHSGSTNNFLADNLEIVEKPGEEAASSAAGAGKGQGEDDAEIPTSKIYISGLSAETSREHLVELFSSIGMIDKEPVLNAKGKTKGYSDEWGLSVKLYKPGQENGDAAIKFVDKVAAKSAIKTFNGHSLKGSIITVQFAGGEWAVAAAEAKKRSRSRSRERLAELERVKKKLKDAEVPREVRGIFGPSN